MSVPVIDADVIARALLEPGTDATQQVVQEFGEGITSGDGSIDRKKLRQRVFDDPDARKTLEAILHPIVHETIQREAAALTSPYCIVVIPLLFEAGHQDLVDRILVVDSTRKNQVMRVKTRDGSSEQEIRKILDSQLTSAERIARADDVIENNNGIEQLETRVRELDAVYRDLAG